MIELQKFVFNPFHENTYLIWDGKTREAVIIDPGCSNSEEEKLLTNFIAEKKLSIKYLFNTHCHVDHVFGNKFIKDNYNCNYYAPELDIPLLDKLVEQAQMFGVTATKSPMPDKFITEDLKLSIGKIVFSFVFTPGHSPGEYCILIEEEKICIGGDVLFLEGIGRTDLWGGDYNTLMESIENKLFPLHNDYIVYPGHGDKTTIGYEKMNNPFLK